MYSPSKIALLIAGLFSTGVTAVPLANRNLFIDGAFDSFTSTGAAIGPASGYVAPTMWVTNAGTGGVGTAGSGDVRNATYASVFDSGPKNCLVFSQTTASTGTVAAGTSPYFGQRMESVQRLAGRTVTVQFKLWVAAGTLNITSLMCRQFFGTGGSPAATVVADKAINWTVGQTPKKFSAKLKVPAITGMAFGTTGDYTFIGLALPPNVTFQLDVTEAQCEYSDPQVSDDLTGNGGAPTAFDYRGEQVELTRVQRYAEVQTYDTSIFATGISYSANSQVFTVPYAVPKIKAPALSLLSGALNVTAIGSGSGTGSFTVAKINQMVIGATLTQSAGGSAYLQGAASILIDARL